MRRRLGKEQIIEWKFCRDDVVYFIRKYGWTKHAVDGAIQWNPYSYQEEFWKTMQAGKSVIVNKTRQIGCSWAAAAYSVWRMIFHPDLEILFLSETEKKAIRLLNNAKFFFNRLPNFLQPEVQTNSQTRFSVRFTARKDDEVYISESSIDSLTLTPRNAAGYSAALIVFDEAAHISGAEEVFMAAKPATAHGGQIAIISTPGGRNNFFFRIWSDSRRLKADGKDPPFIPIEAYWRDCRLTEKWYEIATAGLTKQQILQEFELQFLTAGSPFFDPTQIHKCYYPKDKNPEIINSDDRNILIQTRMSFTGIDTAQGNRTKSGSPDFTSFITLNEFGVEIDSWHSNETPIQDVAGYTLMTEGGIVDIEGKVTQWHNSYRGALIIETFGPGDVVHIRQAQRVPDDDISYVAGRRTTRASKQRMLNTLRLAIAGQQVLITDEFTYDCLLAFEDKGNGKYEATEGFFDDPVIALALAYAELHKWGGYQLELPEGSFGGQRVIGIRGKDDILPEDYSDVLPVGLIIEGPILVGNTGDRLIDEIESWRK